MVVLHQVASYNAHNFRAQQVVPLSCRSYLIFTIYTAIVVARQVHIVIRENVTRPCPGQHFELIDRKTLKIHFEMASLATDADQLFVTEQNGATRIVSFPRCFRARLNFRLQKLIVNPYIELFLQLGTHILCKMDKPQMFDDITHICANITQTNWCPQSESQKLRSMLKGKSTCRFCNLCQPVDSTGRDLESYVLNEGPNQCNFTSLFKTFSLKICTPSVEQLWEKNHPYNRKLEEYWNYLKQGVITAVVHIMDRTRLEEKRLQQCKLMCTTYATQRSIAKSYRTTLLRTIEDLCVPKDSYIACFYHTSRFDVIGT